MNLLTKAAYFWYDVSEGILSNVTTLVIFICTGTRYVQIVCFKKNNKKVLYLFKYLKKAIRSILLKQRHCFKIDMIKIFNGAVLSINAENPWERLGPCFYQVLLIWKTQPTSALVMWRSVELHLPWIKYQWQQRLEGEPIRMSQSDNAFV